MIQQDYVHQIQKVSLRYGKKKSKYSPSFISPAVVVIIVAVLIILINGLHSIISISSYKRKNIHSFHYKKIADNNLPIRPVSRWNYIKELEGHRFDVQNSVKLFKNKKEIKINQIIDKQTQNQTQQAKQIKKKQWQKIQSIKKKNVQPYHILQIPEYIIQKKDQCHWVIQCGAFKDANQAEILRIKLISKGFDFHIKTVNGWNRVILNPIVNSKKNTNKMINFLKTSAYLSCIRLSSRG